MSSKKNFFLPKNGSTIKKNYSSKSLYLYECMKESWQWKFTMQ